KEGYPYPIHEVEKTVKTLDFVRTCMIVSEHHPEHFLNKKFILLIFISPKEHQLLEAKKDEWNQKIQQVIQAEMGQALVHDAIQLYSLYTKMEKQEIDRSWIERHYQNGSLFVKQNKYIYRYLNNLKQYIYENLTYKTNQ